MRAFDIHSPLPAAGVVLLLMNVVTIFPFWPGNVGLVQVAIASALAGYGVAYGNGIAYGFGLQAIEASVGIGVGLLFLAREGLSFAMLRVMPSAAQADLAETEEGGERLPRAERAPAPIEGARRPATLKGVLSARGRRRGARRRTPARRPRRGRRPVADGGEGTIDAAWGGVIREVAVRDAFGAPRTARLREADERMIVEAAEVIPFDGSRLDVAVASSRGLGELIGSLRPRELVVGLGGTANMDGGARAPRGARHAAVPDPGPLRRAHAVLRRAAAVRAAEGRDARADRRARDPAARGHERSRRSPTCRAPAQPEGSERRSRRSARSCSRVRRRSSTSSALRRGTTRSPSPGRARSTRRRAEGKAPAEVARRCGEAGVRCVVFGGRVTAPLPGVETVALSGEPARARGDLVELGLRLGTRLLDTAR